MIDLLYWYWGMHPWWTTLACIWMVLGPLASLGNERNVVKLASQILLTVATIPAVVYFICYGIVLMLEHFGISMAWFYGMFCVLTLLLLPHDT